MPKVAITEIQSLQNEQVAVARINANFVAIQSVIDTLLSRDGAAPNQMVALLDMNGRALVNLPKPVNPNDAARFKEIQDFYALVIEERERAEAAADAAEGFRNDAQAQAGIALGHAQNASDSALEAEAEAIRSENAADRSTDEADRSEQEADRAERARVELETYEIHFFFGGFPYGNELFYMLGTTRPFILLEDEGSFAVARVAAIGTSVILIMKNGVEVGTITFDESAEGVISIPTPTQFDEGDILSMALSDAPDVSLRDISISFLAQRIA
jgi:hypothetical protein